MPEQTRRRWLRLLWMIPAALVLLAAAVLLARWLRELPSWQGFFADYPGEVELPESAPVGFPAWLGWQHFLNAFFLLFIVRSGWQVRGKQRPPAFVTRDNTRFPRTRAAPKRLGLHTWWHLVVDSLFVLNGLVFVVLLIVSGQWMRIVPLSWDHVPNAVSVGIQYLSLDWPTHNGWVNYNSLQLLFYFATVFLAAPLALLTGLRMSPGWPAALTRPTGILGDRFSRTVHFLVLIYFVLFTIAHVTLVFATGALRNLNHMYAQRDDGSWVGFGIFAVSLAVTIAAFVLVTPKVQQRLAAVRGTVKAMPAPPKR